MIQQQVSEVVGRVRAERSRGVMERAAVRRALVASGAYDRAEVVEAALSASVDAIGADVLGGGGSGVAKPRAAVFGT